MQAPAPRDPPRAAPAPWTPPRAISLKVFIQGLRLDAEIGLHSHERGRTQPLRVDVEVDLAPRAVERIADTLNYETLATLARALAARGHVELVETYVQDLAVAVLRSAGVWRVRVRVEKPEALEGVDAAGVELVLESGFG